MVVRSKLFNRKPQDPSKKKRKKKKWGKKGLLLTKSTADPNAKR